MWWPGEAGLLRWGVCITAVLLVSSASAAQEPDIAYVADPAGNPLSRPAKLPTKVGSPVNLIRPDRYEFYTFDETGELIKRLMTLEEIQEIIATGDGDDGHMLTIAQTDLSKPAVTFNFQPPSHVKVHTIVSNVQNVLKAEMEAQKSNPPKPAIFDTPDVSSSWSMILPAIFGNTGGNISPDTLLSAHADPETDFINSAELTEKPTEHADYIPEADVPEESVLDNSHNSDITPAQLSIIEQLQNGMKIDDKFATSFQEKEDEITDFASKTTDDSSIISDTKTSSTASASTKIDHIDENLSTSTALPSTTAQSTTTTTTIKPTTIINVQTTTNSPSTKPSPVSQASVGANNKPKPSASINKKVVTSKPQITEQTTTAKTQEASNTENETLIVESKIEPQIKLPLINIKSEITTTKIPSTDAPKTTLKLEPMTTIKPKPEPITSKPVIEDINTTPKIVRITEVPSTSDITTNKQNVQPSTSQQKIETTTTKLATIELSTAKPIIQVMSESLISTTEKVSPFKSTPTRIASSETQPSSTKSTTVQILSSSPKPLKKDDESKPSTTIAEVKTAISELEVSTSTRPEMSTNKGTTEKHSESTTQKNIIASRPSLQSDLDIGEIMNQIAIDLGDSTFAPIPSNQVINEISKNSEASINNFTTTKLVMSTTEQSIKVTSENNHLNIKPSSIKDKNIFTTESTITTMSNITPKINSTNEMKPVTKEESNSITTSSPIELHENITFVEVKPILRPQQKNNTASSQNLPLNSEIKSIPTKTSLSTTELTTEVSSSDESEYLEIIQTTTPNNIEVTKSNIHELSDSITDLISQIVDSRPTLIPMTKVQNKSTEIVKDITTTSTLDDNIDYDDNEQSYIDINTEDPLSDEIETTQATPTKPVFTTSPALGDQQLTKQNISVSTEKPHEIKATTEKLVSDKETPQVRIDITTLLDIIPTTYRPTNVFNKNIAALTTHKREQTTSKIESNTSEGYSSTEKIINLSMVNSEKIKETKPPISSIISQTENPKTQIKDEPFKINLLKEKDSSSNVSQSTTNKPQKNDEILDITETSVTEDDEMTAMLNRYSEMFQITSNAESKSEDDVIPSKNKTTTFKPMEILPEEPAMKNNLPIREKVPSIKLDENISPLGIVNVAELIEQSEKLPINKNNGNIISKTNETSHESEKSTTENNVSTSKLIQTNERVVPSTPQFKITEDTIIKEQTTQKARNDLTSSEPITKVTISPTESTVQPMPVQTTILTDNKPSTTSKSHEISSTPSMESTTTRATEEYVTKKQAPESQESDIDLKTSNTEYIKLPNLLLLINNSINNEQIITTGNNRPSSNNNIVISNNLNNMPSQNSTLKDQQGSVNTNIQTSNDSKIEQQNVKMNISNITVKENPAQIIMDSYPIKNKTPVKQEPIRNEENIIKNIGQITQQFKDSLEKSSESPLNVNNTKVTIIHENKDSQNIEPNPIQQDSEILSKRTNIIMTAAKNAEATTKSIIDQFKLPSTVPAEIILEKLPQITTNSSNLIQNPTMVLLSTLSPIPQTKAADYIVIESEKHTSPKPNDKTPSFEEIKIEIPKPSKEDVTKTNQTANKNSVIDNKNTWKLIPTVKPANESEKQNNSSNIKFAGVNSAKPLYFQRPPTSEELKNNIKKITQTINGQVDLPTNGGQGLEKTTNALGKDVYEFSQLCNELALRYWNAVSSNGLDQKRSLVVSPFAVTSILAMMFLGARGATSGEMNDILKLDDMVTFNPHIVFKNVTESIEVSKKSGVATSAFIRELYSDRSKGKLLSFYKDRVQQFYSGHVEEVNFKLIGDVIRRRTNLLVKRQTWGKIPEYIKGNNMILRPPLSVFAANIFQTDCSIASTDGRDGEMYFVVSPTIRQRRLVPVPAVLYKKGFLAGYITELDATAAAIGESDQIVSTILVMPALGSTPQEDDILDLQKRIVDSAYTEGTWSKLLRSLVPRQGLELQIPRFSHRSVINGTSALQQMGLKDLFNAEKADLRGLNGIANDLFLSDMMLVNTFTTCGEGYIGEQHHVEVFPGEPIKVQRRLWRTPQRPSIQESFQPPVSGDIWEEPRDYQRAFHDPLHDTSYLSMPLHLRPRQARLPETIAEPPRLKFDRPFMFFVRHNPTGLILHMGRYNPRLLP